MSSACQATPSLQVLARLSLCAQLWTSTGTSGTQKEAGALWRWQYSSAELELGYLNFWNKSGHRKSDTYQQNTGLWWLSLQVCVVWDWDSDNLLPEDTNSSFTSKFLQRMSFIVLCCLPLDRLHQPSQIQFKVLITAVSDCFIIIKIPFSLYIILVIERNAVVLIVGMGVIIMAPQRYCRGVTSSHS